MEFVDGFAGDGDEVFGDFESIGVLDAEDVGEFAAGEEVEEGEEIFAVVACGFGCGGDVVGLVGNGPSVVVTLDEEVAAFGNVLGNGFVVGGLIFASDDVFDGCFGHEVAFVGGVDVGFGAEGLCVGFGFGGLTAGVEGGGEDAGGERARAGEAAEGVAGEDGDGGVFGEHLLEDELIDFWLGEVAFEGGFGLGGVGAVSVSVVFFDALVEVPPEAGEGGEGAEVSVGESVGDHAADERIGLDEEDGAAFSGSGAGGGDACGGASVNKEVVDFFLPGESVGEEQQEKEAEQGEAFHVGLRKRGADVDFYIGRNAGEVGEFGRVECRGSRERWLLDGGLSGFGGFTCDGLGFRGEGGCFEITSVKMGAVAVVMVGVGGDDFKIQATVDEGDAGLVGLVGVASLVAEPADGRVPSGDAGKGTEVEGFAANDVEFEEELIGFFDDGESAAFAVDPESGESVAFVFEEALQPFGAFFGQLCGGDEGSCVGFWVGVFAGSDFGLLITKDDPIALDLFEVVEGGFSEPGFGFGPGGVEFAISFGEAGFRFVQ